MNLSIILYIYITKIFFQPNGVEKKGRIWKRGPEKLYEGCPSVRPARPVRPRRFFEAGGAKTLLSAGCRLTLPFPCGTLVSYLKNQ